MQIIFYLDIVYTYGAGCIHSGITLTVPTKYDYAGIRRSLRRLGKTLRIILLVGIQNFSTMVFTVWLLHVLAHDDHFGSQPDRNQSVKYVLFFRQRSRDLNQVANTLRCRCHLCRIVILIQVRHDREGIFFRSCVR